MHRKPHRIGEHAVVLGAGMAGLLAARVLSEAYERVTIVERDVLPQTGQGRKGVPQGRHAHLLLPGGQHAIEALFPNLVNELIDRGVGLSAVGADTRVTLSGHELLPVDIDERALQVSRPLLEGYLRERVGELSGVEVVEACDAVGLTTSAAGSPAAGRITGVRIMRRAPGSAEEALAADLVVDATGRAARSASWSDSLGYTRPPDEELPVDVSYASLPLRLPPAFNGLPKVVIVGPRPDRPRSLVLLTIEGGRRMLTLTGVGAANRPPTDPAGFLAHAETVAPPDVLAAIRAAEALGEVVPHRFPSNRRRHYERLRTPPDGLLVIGDALCNLDPIYAQGMTVAALQALALRDCLRGGAHGLGRRYFRAAAAATEDAWKLTIGSDLALPQVEGPRPRMVRVLNAYVARAQSAAERDEVVSAQFLRVMCLLDRPTRLLRPSIFARVRRAGRSDSPLSTPQPALEAQLRSHDA